MTEVTLREMKDIINAGTHNVHILTLYNVENVDMIKPGIKQICANLGIEIPKFVCMDAKYNHNKAWAFAFDGNVKDEDLNPEIYKAFGIKTEYVDDLHTLLKKHVPVRCALHE